MRKKGTEIGVYLFLTLAGALAGTVIGDSLAAWVPILGKAYTVGVPRVDLVVLGFGVWIKLNVAGAIGMVTMLVLFRRR